MGFFDEYDWKMPVMGVIVALFLLAIGRFGRQVSPPSVDFYAQPEQQQAIKQDDR